MPNLMLNENVVISPLVQEKPVVNEKRKPFVSEEQLQRHFGVEESRRVLYDERKVEARRPVPNTRVSQLVLPPKPRSRDSLEREITMRLVFLFSP